MNPKLSAWLDCIICYFFGIFGVHKFREKKYGMGILYIFTVGLFGIGWLIDFIKYLIIAIKITMMRSTVQAEAHYSDIVEKRNAKQPFSFKKAAVIIAACLGFFILIGIVGSSGDDAPPKDDGKDEIVSIDKGTVNEEDKTEITTSDKDHVKVPVSTKDEDTTKKPESTKKSETTKKPETVKKPETTKVPETTVHEHNFLLATCTAPKTCLSCGATDGTANGHNWQSATCTSPKKCAVCSATEGSANGHNWKNATCTSPKTCTSCQVTEGSAKGHSYYNGTCTSCSATDPQYNSGVGRITYVLNTKSKKFHHTYCGWLPTDNRQDTTLSRDELVAQGYTPCGHCDP